MKRPLSSCQWRALASRPLALPGARRRPQMDCEKRNGCQPSGGMDLPWTNRQRRCVSHMPFQSATYTVKPSCSSRRQEPFEDWYSASVRSLSTVDSVDSTRKDSDAHHLPLPPPPAPFSSHATAPMVSYDQIPEEIAAVMEDYARHSPTIISLQELLQRTKDITGTPSSLTTQTGPAARLARREAGERGLMEFAQMLRRELPIRLAHRIQDLDGIPQLRNMPSVQTVKGIYIHSFLALLEIEHPVSPALESKFGELLQELYQNHSRVLVQMAKGAWELKTKLKLQGRAAQKGLGQKHDYSIVSFAQQEECHAFLNRFYSSRIGIRVLAGQYLAVRQQWVQQSHPRSLRISASGNTINPPPSTPLPPSHQYVGMICQDTSPYEIVQSAIHDATHLCVAQFGEAPQIVVRGRLDLTFPYLPTHLHYIVLELLKNALRATVEHYYETHPKTSNDDKDDDDQRPGSALSKYSSSHNIKATPFPDVVVIIADHTENEDVVIKISDEGGGIPRSRMEHIWSYLYTTADPHIQEGFLKGRGAGPQQDNLVLAGLGYGLPMSRAYAQYFGGDVDIISMEGYGTDCFVYLVRLGDTAPVLNV